MLLRVPGAQRSVATPREFPRRRNPGPRYTHPIPNPDLRLPPDLVSFLARGDAPRSDPSRCECGQITLLPLSNLRIGEIWVTTEGTAQADDDPNRGRDGTCTVPAVNLVAEAGGYAPEFVLCWLPDLQQLGAWDCDHGTLLTFPGATWTTIAPDPAPCIDAQRNYTGLGRDSRPWACVSFLLNAP